MKLTSFLKSTAAFLLAAVFTGASLPASEMQKASAETDKVIALTFDDGPNTTTTNAVLDLLEEYDARASFFLIGNNINEESAVSVKRAYDMGCEINNHSKSHSNMGSMAAEEIIAEIEYVNNYVYEITGEYPKFFRPPFIDTSQTMYDAIDLPFICGLDTKDYMADVSAQQRAETVLNAAKDGLIILMHDAAGNDQTVEALKTIIPELQKQGYEFVTLTELFERQGETPKETLLYSEVAKYPCTDYSLHRNIFTGEASGETSWSGWSETAVLDGAELAALGDTFAIEVDYESTYYPVIALQQWSGGSLWYAVTPSYYNGERACFLASDLQKALDENGVTFEALDRITITPFGAAMTMTRVDILVKDTADTTLSGDVNLDGTLNITDIILLQKYLLTLESLTEAQVQNADLDGSTAANGFDLALLKRAVLT